MKILTAAQMQRIDRLTTDRYGVPSLTLMENAGRGFVEFLADRFSPLAEQRIVILCGRGNNGGDGMVVARLLREQGLKPRVLLLTDPNGLKGDAAVNWQRLATSGAPEVVEDSAAWEPLRPSLRTPPWWSTLSLVPDFQSLSRGFSQKSSATSTALSPRLGSLRWTCLRGFLRTPGS
jgi:NAD(P)H-hydrate epimerase